MEHQELRDKIEEFHEYSYDLAYDLWTQSDNGNTEEECDVLREIAAEVQACHFKSLVLDQLENTEIQDLLSLLSSDEDFHSDFAGWYAAADEWASNIADVLKDDVKRYIVKPEMINDELLSALKEFETNPTCQDWYVSWLDKVQSEETCLLGWQHSWVVRRANEAVEQAEFDSEDSIQAETVAFLDFVKQGD